jgi:DNA-directed RNA polymerase subunit M/transcription elongation factor TFIIS
MVESAAKHCQHCGSELVVIRKFCPECGKPLARKKRGSHQLESDLKSQAAAKVPLRSKEETDVKVKIKPPPTAVKNIKELIYWEYAKIMAEAAHFDGNYGFIMSRYMKLKRGEIKWTPVDEDAAEMTIQEKSCIYCGSTEDLTLDRLIPHSKGGPTDAANIVPACKKCNSSKADKDVFEWYYLVKKAEKIPKQIWKRYLKLVWNYHVAQRTIEKVDINQDGKLDIPDIAAIFRRKTR